MRLLLLPLPYLFSNMEWTHKREDASARNALAAGQPQGLHTGDLSASHEQILAVKDTRGRPDLEVYACLRERLKQECGIWAFLSVLLCL